MSQPTSVHRHLFTDMSIHGGTIGFWHATPDSPLREVVQRLLAANLKRQPAHDGTNHWCGYLRKVPDCPEYDVGTEHWQPGIHSPSPPAMQAELFVATLRPKGFTEPVLAQTEKGIAYAALLPHSLQRGFDPSVPDEVAVLGPWLELDMDVDWASPTLSTMMGRIGREGAKFLGLGAVYHAEPMPDSRRLPKTWRSHACEAEYVLPYCMHIPTADGSPRRDLVVLKIPLTDVSPSGYWN